MYGVETEAKEVEHEGWRGDRDGTSSKGVAGDVEWTDLQHKGKAEGAVDG